MIHFPEHEKIPSWYVYYDILAISNFRRGGDQNLIVGSNVRSAPFATATRAREARDIHKAFQGSLLMESKSNLKISLRIPCTLNPKPIFPPLNPEA